MSSARRAGAKLTFSAWCASLAAKSPEPFRSMGIGVFSVKSKPLTWHERDALSYYLMGHHTGGTPKFRSVAERKRFILGQRKKDRDDLKREVPTYSLAALRTRRAGDAKLRRPTSKTRGKGKR